MESTPTTDQSIRFVVARRGCGGSLWMAHRFGATLLACFAACTGGAPVYSTPADTVDGDTGTAVIALPEIHLCNRFDPTAPCPDGASVAGDREEFCVFRGGTGHGRWARYSCREPGDVDRDCTFLTNRPELRVDHGSCISAIVDEMAFELRWNDEDSTCGTDAIPCPGDPSKTGLIHGGVLGDDWGDGIGEDVFHGGAGELIAAVRRHGARAVAVRWQQGWPLNLIFSGTGWMTHKSEDDQENKYLRPSAVQAWVADHVALGHPISTYGCSGGNSPSIRGWLQHGLRNRIRHIMIGGGAGWNTAAGCGCLDGTTNMPADFQTVLRRLTREPIDYLFRTGNECQGELSFDLFIPCPECRDGDCEYPLSRHGNYPAAWDAGSLDPDISGQPVDLTVPEGSRLDLIETAFDRTLEPLFDRLRGNKFRHVLRGGGHCDWTKKGAWGSRTACTILQRTHDLDPKMCDGFCGYENEPCASDADCCGGRTCAQGTCTCAPAGDPCTFDADCCPGLVCLSKVCGS